MSLRVSQKWPTINKKRISWILGRCKICTTQERWDEDERSLGEMVELLKEALAFEGRTNGRERIIALELSNEQVAQRIVKIYEEVLRENPHR